MLRSVYKHTPAVVGLLLLFAGIYKVVYPAEAMAAVVALDVPGHWADFAVVVVTILELYVGTIILLRVDLKWGLRMATALVLSFAAFLFFLATMAHPPSCGCMGLTALFRSNRHSALFGLLRNCIILWLLKGAYEYHFPSAVIDRNRIP